MPAALYRRRRSLVRVTTTATECCENRTHVVRLIFITAQSVTVEQNRCRIGIEPLQPVESVRYLGVYLDSSLSMQTHVAKVTQTCFFQLSRLRQIRCLLGRDVTTDVMAALVLTQLDYCNALLADLPYSTVAICRGSLTLPRGSCVAFDRKTTSWTPPSNSIGCRSALGYSTFCLLVHRALNGQSPNYVAELLQPVTTRHSSLRSVDKNVLLVPRTSLKFGKRAFSVAGPAAWNSLPTDIRITTSCPAPQSSKRNFKHFIY